MHVEVRLCQVEQVCAFDPQSFYRVKQLLSWHSGPSGGDEEPVKRASHGGTLLRLRHSGAYTPQLKLQVVVERLIEMESTCFCARMDWRQHEARAGSHWNNSAVGTAYHSAAVEEVVLAALPLAAADSVVKIRLLQLPPPLDYDSQQVVKRAIGNVTVGGHRHDTPLCIGVTKISLRELMAARGTIRIAMQAKRTIVSTVEAHNLDTLMTNAMFGRSESSGSAVLSVQVNGYTFGRVPRGRPMPASAAATEVAKRSLTAKDPESPGAPLPSASSGAADDATVDLEAESLNSPAIRSVLIPYVALADVLLRAGDVVSWRVPRKTGTALATVAIALYADLFDVLFVLTAALAVLCVARNVSLFSYAPAAGEPMASSTFGSGANNFQPFLYSRDNALMNSLLRARVFFSRGLLEDTYYELAFAAHVARRCRRQLAGYCVAVCCGFALLSMGTVVILLTIGAFTVYPVFLNLQGARRRSRRRTAASLLALLRHVTAAVHVPQRWRVVRVIHVAVSRTAATARPSANGSVAGSTMESLQQQFLNCIRQRTDSIGLATPTERSEASLKTRENSSAVAHRRTQTVDLDMLASHSVNFVSTLDRFQVTHVMRYFAALCFSPSVADAVGLANTTSGARRQSSNAVLQRRLCEQLRLARSLSGVLPTDVPQANNISGTNGPIGLNQQSSVSLAESRQAPVTRETQEVFQAYFNHTLSLLFYLRQQWTLHPYVTQSATTKCMPDSMRGVSVLVEPQGLVDVGEDDGVTKALLARRHSRQNTPTLGKPSGGSPVEVNGRVMALYAAYLLQGARLSVYTSSSGCGTVVPLLAPGNRMERFPQPNPCPPDLLSTLDSVWRGETSDPSGAGREVYFNADAVLQIITVYKDYWEGGGPLAATRSSVRFDVNPALGETPAATSPPRNAIRHVLAALPTLSRQSTAQRAGGGGGGGGGGAGLLRSPQVSTVFRPSGAGTSPAPPPADAVARAATTAAATTRETHPAPAPLHLPPPAATEPLTMSVVSATSTASSTDITSGPSGAVEEPPMLEATSNGDARGQPLSGSWRVDSPDPQLSATRQPSGKRDAAERPTKTRW
ncbi:hypothetical protein NESM_000601300 [Novymonas esmeraldas]|uniref:Uncharacterized protein n=1 Tax=Novymonas esmeraldas TaxID=1808958 RepID=A0AAW0EU78_9TRYP